MMGGRPWGLGTLPRTRRGATVGSGWRCAGAAVRGVGGARAARALRAEATGAVRCVYDRFLI